MKPTYKILETRFDNLNISRRLNNVLRSASLHTIKDLAKYTECDLLKFKNFGRKALIEIFTTLKGIQKFQEINFPIYEHPETLIKIEDFEPAPAPVPAPEQKTDDYFLLLELIKTRAKHFHKKMMMDGGKPKDNYYYPVYTELRGLPDLFYKVKKTIQPETIKEEKKEEKKKEIIKYNQTPYPGPGMVKCYDCIFRYKARMINEYDQCRRYPPQIFIDNEGNEIHYFPLLENLYCCGEGKKYE